ncbi:MAG: Type 1 glutamine amidotransferase-like domain-containing protein [Christensenellales bacterium]
MNTRIIYALGGGDLRNKSTLEIDKVIAKRAKERAGDKRAMGVFFGTASHDSLPYFNSFRKIYTSVFDIKAEIALLTKKDIPLENIQNKLDKADFIYIGGGDTMFMLDVWQKTGIDKMIIDAYMKGVMIVGLSAGAICHFENMYTDSEMLNGNSDTYSIHQGLSILKGTMSPHYNYRKEFDHIAKNLELAYAVEDDCALLFENESLINVYSAGGKAFKFSNGIKEEIKF